jgi:hypothetical protein
VTPAPFEIAVPDEVLDDLREQLRRTRFTGPSAPEPWVAGTDPGYLRELVAYWVDGFDWRAAEAGLNSAPQFMAEVAGRKVHFAGYAHFPRSLADRIFSDLRHWATPERGGHFMAHEEPEQTAREIAGFFRQLRPGPS